MPLSMMAEMSLYDANGNCRCPRCGKYCNREDIPDQTTEARAGSAIVSFVPACRKCLEPPENNPETP